MKRFYFNFLVFARKVFFPKIVVGLDKDRFNVLAFRQVIFNCVRVIAAIKQSIFFLLLQNEKHMISVLELQGRELYKTQMTQ